MTGNVKNSSLVDLNMKNQFVKTMGNAKNSQDANSDTIIKQNQCAKTMVNALLKIANSFTCKLIKLCVNLMDNATIQIVNLSITNSQE